MLERPKESVQKPVFILFGMPGTGKSTQGELLYRQLGLPHISTGNLFREAIEEQSSIGLRAKTYMEKGQLVPNELTLEILKEALLQKNCKNGFILDGFPRTIEQASLLDQLLKPMNFAMQAVFNIDISVEEAIERLSKRRVCKECKAIYHLVNNPPRVDEVCDKCGAKLIQRNDDKAEVIRARLLEYRKKTNPLVEYYQKKNVLLNVNGARTVPSIFEEISAKLSAYL